MTILIHRDDRTLCETEARQLINAAIGRLFLLGSRPYQPGDEKQFADCRQAVLEAAEVLDICGGEYYPCWTRDRLLGAQGDE